MGACASKSWEIDLRDICQRLRCFFVCCRGQIIVHTSGIDGSESEFEIQDDKKIMTPVLFGLILYFYVVQPDVERLPGS